MFLPNVLESLVTLDIPKDLLHARGKYFIRDIVFDSSTKIIQGCSLQKIGKVLHVELCQKAETIAELWKKELGAS